MNLGADGYDLAFRGYRHASLVRRYYDIGNTAYKFVKWAGNTYLNKNKMTNPRKRGLHELLKEKSEKMLKRLKDRLGNHPTYWLRQLARRGKITRSRYKGVGAGAVRVTGTKKITKKRKNVKVSKTLRKKINKVITGTKPVGTTQEITYGVMRLVGTEDFKQICQDITISNSSLTNPHFCLNKILDAASVLWNEKTQAEYPKNVGDARNFDPKKLKVKVIASSVTYNFKNNTQRKVFIKLMEVYPKSKQVAGDPFQIWTQALAFQAATEGPNQTSTLKTEMYTSPAMLPDFRQLFTVRSFKLEIPAGGEYQHVIQGPKDKMIDFQKAWNGSLYQNVNTECCWLLSTLWPDLVTTSLGSYGRYMNDTSADQLAYGVVFEAIARFKLEMPELVGTISAATTAGDPVPLAQRQFSYAYKTFPPVIGTVGGVISVNDENPIGPVANP